MRPRIAISVSRQQPDPNRGLFKNKPLQYLEEGMVAAVARAGGLPFLVPDLRDERFDDWVIAACDGLLLSGGEDVAPVSYGEAPLREEWAGDRSRDLYELALLHAAIDRGVPVLGICRGCQLINVAMGGTLWQDVAEQVDGAIVHRDADLYDRLCHDVEVVPDSRLAGMLAAESARVNSVHHQAVRDAGTGLRVVSRAPDGTVEAVEGLGERFLLGVQWHPEWQPAQPDPVMAAFVHEARRFAT